MKKDKKILKILAPTLGIVFLFVVFAISNNKHHNIEEQKSLVSLSYENNLNDEANPSYTISSSMSYEYPSYNKIYEESQYVAIVKIESIDGANNYSSVNDYYVYPYTYGKMKVLQVLKGNLSIDSIVNFYRLGGKISADRYYESLSASQKEMLAGLKGSNEELDFRIDDDIKIETGKAYLVYLQDEKFYEGKTNSYTIYGLQVGLREIKEQQSSTHSTQSTNEIQILNNFTGEYENLSDVIPQ